jgi:outer membrane protein TolC
MRCRAINRIAWLTVLVLVLAPAARAQTRALTLTLDEAIARGTANSMRLAELQARQEAAAAVEDRRGADKLPVTSLLGGYTRTNHVEQFILAQIGQGIRVLYPDVPDNYHARLDLQWPIYTGGRTDALERAARAEREAAGEDLAAARADLRLEITRAFWALVTARDTALVLGRSLESIDSHVRDLRNRLQQGLIPPNDVLTADAQLARERLLAIEADTASAVAEADLQRLLGLDAAQTIQPQAALEEPAAAQQALTALLESAKSGRAERRALVDRAEAAEARIDAAAASAKPQLSVFGGYDYARPNPRIFPRADEWEDSWDLSLNVSWAFWDSGRSRADRAEAAANASAVKARLSDLDRQIAFEVRQRQLELDASRAAVPVANAGVRAAVEARRVLGERFNAGVATSTDVLDAQTDVLQAELQLTRALANVRLAEARLERAIGGR